MTGDEVRDGAGRLVSVVVDGQRFHRAPEQRSDDEIGALCDAATPGPWRADGRVIRQDGEDGELVLGNLPRGGTLAYDADIAFMAAARELVPSLLAERDSLRGVVQALPAKLEKLRDEMDFRDARWAVDEAVKIVRAALVETEQP